MTPQKLEIPTILTSTIDGTDGIKAGEFAAGLFQMAMPGVLVKKVRLTPEAKKVILDLIEEDKSRTSTRFADDDIHFEYFMEGMSWLEQKLKSDTVGGSLKLRFNGIIARELYFFVSRHKNYHLGGTPEFEIAMQRICNQWNSRFSLFDIVDLEYRKRIKKKEER